MVVLAAVVFLQSCHHKDAASSKLKIAVVPKGTTHVFWKSVEKGARRAADELGVEIIWKGPLEENDRSQQMDIVRDFKADRVSAIVLAPLDDKELVKPVQEATAAKIPVVIIDSGLKATVGQDFVSFVATDNHKGGELAGEKMVSLLGGKGKIVMLRYMVGSASTAEREDGFMQVIGKAPGIEVLSENQYADATAITAQEKSMSMLDVLRKADGIFCPNESSTVGMLKTLQQAGITGKVKFVGFDSTRRHCSDALKGWGCRGIDRIRPGQDGV